MIKRLIQYLQSDGALRRSVFQGIYRKNSWGCQESRSGTGSTIKQTDAVRSELKKFLISKNVKSIVDVACGDWNWMKYLMSDPELEYLDYVGIDIVEDVVKMNIERYAAQNVRFEVSDAVSDTIPTAEVVMARDVLVHLPTMHAVDMMHNIRKAASRYIVLTTFTSLEDNRDIRYGDWRPLNLELPPFSLGKADYILEEKCTENDLVFWDKALGVWEV